MKTKWVVVIDKDFTEITAIRTFPSSPSDQLEFLGSAGESNSGVGNSKEPKMVSMPGPAFEKMNHNQHQLCNKDSKSCHRQLGRLPARRLCSKPCFPGIRMPLG
ncbi:unnamed protein product [Ixodes hexagonus]